MKLSKLQYKIYFLFMFIFISCAREKLQEIDKLSGLDGSFEMTDSGFSIKWQINKALLNSRDAKIFLDKKDKKDGSQSLKMQIPRTDASKQNPGISTRLAVMPDKKYHLSFWLKNNAGYSVNWKSVTGAVENPGRLGLVVRGEKTSQDWIAYADTISIETGENSLQLEFTLTKPGELWIDNVMFEEAH